MPVYPVILCGGGGARLWPASSPERPKPFLSLVGSSSLFQETALRVAGVDDLAQIVVVANAAHGELIAAQLGDVGLGADLLLEPVGRDSGPAIAAAAAWIARMDPDAVVVVVASDHHLPDTTKFAKAVRTAVPAAREGRIVTFGVAPREASSAYGYIRPAKGPGPVLKVSAFVEKPAASVAQGHIEAGYLWNSGNFVAMASTLIAAFAVQSPEILAVALKAVETARQDGAGARLGAIFATAPKVSFDYAVMEKSPLASVLPVDFAWSDLGAWSAVRAVSPLDALGNAISGEVISLDSQGCLIRTDGPQVAAIGLRNLAVVAENGAVLVCDLARDQDARLAQAKVQARQADLAAQDAKDVVGDGDRALRALDVWLRTAALPLWWTLGADHDGGGFHEALDPDGRPTDAPRRVRVQARQAFVYARAARLGWAGPWRAACDHAFLEMERRFLRPDGLYRRAIAAGGAVVDDTALVYDQAFVLLALAARAAVAEPADRQALSRKARALLDAMAPLRVTTGGYVEVVEPRFQSNAHMHLFEAALAWLEVPGEPEGPWRTLALEIGALALDHFIDGEQTVVREVFDQAWRPDLRQEGRGFLPGHQFEWAWLLHRWRLIDGMVDRSLIHGLYRAGRTGVDEVSGVAANSMSDGCGVLDGTARLWPQTEHLRAADMMWQTTGEPIHARHRLQAARAVRTYLETQVRGLWWDRRDAKGTFADEPAPASSLYHLMALMAPG